MGLPGCAQADTVAACVVASDGRAALRRRARVAADAVVTLNGVPAPLKLAVTLKK